MRTILLLASFASALLAQSGHWEGTIQVPSGDLKFEIDLEPEGGGWHGTISVPAQGTKGMPLSNIAVKDNVVAFALKAPGDPQFKGTVKDGKEISGEMVQGGQTMPFSLTRTGDAKIDKIRNAAISKELEGSWEGMLDANGKMFRLRFQLTNKEGAGATGMIVSLDQGGQEIPITKITETAMRVKLEVPVISGGFEGEMKGNQIVGEWAQGGGTVPLTLTKLVK